VAGPDVAIRALRGAAPAKSSSKADGTAMANNEHRGLSNQAGSASKGEAKEVSGKPTSTQATDGQTKKLERIGDLAKIDRQLSGASVAADKSRTQPALGDDKLAALTRDELQAVATQTKAEMAAMQAGLRMKEAAMMKSAIKEITKRATKAIRSHLIPSWDRVRSAIQAGGDNESAEKTK